MQASDSIESLSSPPQRANSTLEKGTSPRRIAECGPNASGTATRKFRSGSDTAAWERKVAEPRFNQARRGIEKETKETPTIIATVPPIIPARNLSDVFSVTEAASVIPLASPPRRKGHRPRSQSWSASNRLDFTKLERPPTQALRLQKKRSEPILNSALDTSGFGNPAIPLRTLHGSLGPALEVRPTERSNKDWHSGTLAPIHGIISPDHDMNACSPESTSSRLINPYSPPNRIEDVYDSPTRTVLEDQDAAMRALEDALNGPKSGGTGDAWPVVDFGGNSVDTARSETTPRPISPREVQETSTGSLRSPERTLRREVRTMETNKTPPREPLPRLPFPLEIGHSRDPDQRGSYPFKYSYDHSKSDGEDHKDPVGKEGEVGLDALPRLSYSFAKPKSKSRSRSSVKPDNQESDRKRSRRTLKVDSAGSFEEQPRLIDIVYPRSAPATESLFRVDLGKRLRQRTGSLGEAHEVEDGAVSVVEGTSGGMGEMLKREREGKKRLECELMRLQGRWLGAVGRIARSVLGLGSNLYFGIYGVLIGSNDGIGWNKRTNSSEDD